MESKKATLTFCGGTGEVTGANFLMEIEGKKFLVDCGMVQGSEEADEKNYQAFPYDPATIDALIVTHAHQDHIGRIPKLVKDGFRGVIYSTSPTRDIAEIALDDTANILAQRAKLEEKEPLFTTDDIAKAMRLWKVHPYHENFEFLPGVSFLLRDAGHVLGSSLVEISYGKKKILFTGDLGNSPSPLLRDIEEVADIDYVVMESVYGDRNHDPREDRTKELERVIEDAIHKKGVLMIPSFSLERTQELLAELNDLVENERIPHVPIFLDSPLAERITGVYQHSTEFFNKEKRGIINGGDDIFNFPGLKITSTVEESKAINRVPAPKIIIAGSGMMVGGRIMHHALQYLSDPNNTILFVGYQAAGTAGRVISSGTKKVKIFREDVQVRAKVEQIHGYSGHAGMDDLVGFIDQIKDSVSKVFCVMGEPSSSLFLVQRLRDYLGVNAVAPEEGESVELEF